MPTSKTRAGYNKSTRGCKTCKIRKVKCDETYPECNRCHQTGWTCDGPVPQTNGLTFVATDPGQHRRSSVVTAQSHTAYERGRSEERSHVSNPFLHTSLQAARSQQPYQERRAFSFFVSKAAPFISGALDLDLWGQLVPQVAHDNDAVWNAVISMGQLWEHPIKHMSAAERASNRLSDDQVLALRWYDRAICAQRTMSNGTNATDDLLSCTLFASIELQKRNFENGYIMLRLGFNMLAHFLTAGHGTCSFAIAHALGNKYLRSICLMSTSRLNSRFDATAFSDREGAQAVLIQIMYATYGLIKEMYYRLNAHGLTVSQLACRRSCLKSSLSDWKARLNYFRTSEAASKLLNHSSELEHLDDYCDVMGLWLESGAQNAETISQTNDQLFCNILDTAEKIVALLTCSKNNHKKRPPFFFDIALLPPLYLVITVSGNSSIRDRALDLTKRYTSQKYGEQLHGLIVVEDLLNPSIEGQAFLMQTFRTQWDVNGKKTLISNYARIVV